MENDSLDVERKMFWDVDIRLVASPDNGKTGRYAYNAAGERIVKTPGGLEGVYANGSPQGITLWLSPTSVQVECKTSELALHSVCTEVPRNGK